MARPLGVSVSIGSVGVDRLRERSEFHSAIAQAVEHRYQVAQAAAQPVELPHNERVAALQLLHAAEQGRALGDRA